MYITVCGPGIMVHRRSFFLFLFLQQEKANSNIAYLLGEKQIHGLLGQFKGSPKVLITYQRVEKKQGRPFIRSALTNVSCHFCQISLPSVGTDQCLLLKVYDRCVSFPELSKHLCEPPDWRRKKSIVFQITGQLFGHSVVFKKEHGIGKQETRILPSDMC